MAEFSDELLVEAITNYMVVNGCGKTTSGSWIFTFQDIAEHFHITLARVEELENQIIYSLYSCPQVCDENGVWTFDSEFNILFYGNYCDVDMED